MRIIDTFLREKMQKYPSRPRLGYLPKRLDNKRRVLGRQCAMFPINGGIGQSNVAQMARSNSASRTVTC
jgi:hypothetical protein